MTDSVPRGLVLFLIGLPVSYILTALVIVALGLPVVTHIILPWAASLALFVGLLAGSRQRSR